MEDLSSDQQTDPRTVSIELIDAMLRDFGVGEFDLRTEVDLKLKLLAHYCSQMLDDALCGANVDRDEIEGMSRKEKKELWKAIRMSLESNSDDDSDERLSDSSTAATLMSTPIATLMEQMQTNPVTN